MHHLFSIVFVMPTLSSGLLPTPLADGNAARDGVGHPTATTTTPGTAPRCLARHREWRGGGQGRRQPRVIMFGDSCHSLLPVSGSIIHYTSVRTPLCARCTLSDVRCPLSVRIRVRAGVASTTPVTYSVSIRLFSWRVPVPLGGKG